MTTCCQSGHAYAGGPIPDACRSRRAHREPQPLPPSAAAAGEFEAWLEAMLFLTLTMSHTHKQLDAAIEAVTQDKPLNDICRTYVHELTHSAQALGSTLGYYTWMLRSTQADYVLRMLKWLVKADLPVMMPLLDYLPTLDAYDDMATGMVHGWQITESLISELAGSVPGFLHAGVQEPMAGITWPERWKRLQSNITELYESPGHKRPDQFFMALWAEPVVSYDDQQASQVQALLVSRLFTIPAVMESAALAVELSPADEKGLSKALAAASRAGTGEEHEMYDSSSGPGEPIPACPRAACSPPTCRV